ncbi:MAG: tRNA pseudouridine(38-40) synthase TruA [Rickettsiaceae bacterium]|nr:tRNA pseudouridine(38-40) synthase TruA [Rickettsiaceae bacterium]
MENFRYKITIEYLGTNLVGWQKQNNGTSIQQLIEDAIYCYSKFYTTLHASGRTDAGVHAMGQVAHFDLPKKYETSVIISATNHFLKNYDIMVTSCEYVSADFHARFSTKSRSYVYRIFNSEVPSVIMRKRAWWIKEKLNVLAMQKAATHLIGTHDFSSFRAQGCYSKSPVKTINSIEITEENNIIELYFEAKSFLYHMVRNFVGSLVMVGLEKWDASYMKQVLELRDRKFAAATSPACGLYLNKITY